MAVIIAFIRRGPNTRVLRGEVVGWFISSPGKPFSHYAPEKSKLVIIIRILRAPYNFTPIFDLRIGGRVYLVALHPDVRWGVPVLVRTECLGHLPATYNFEAALAAAALEGRSTIH